MPRARPIPAVLLVLAAACGGGSHPRATSTTSTTSAGAATSTPAAGIGGTTVAPAKPSGTTTGAAGAAANTTTTAAPAGKAQAGPAPVPAGTYRYRQSGSATVGTTAQPAPAEGTLVADAAKSDGTQVFHRAADPKKPPSDATFVFRSDGMFIKSTVTRATVGTQTVSFTCTFAPPVPAPPWPPAVGKAFTADGNCGSFTAHVDGHITGQRQASVDGASRTVYVVSTTIVTHGQVESTINETDWFAPSLRLSLHVESHTKGTYGPVAFSGDLTSDLESAKPS